ncbi:MAG: hypothetical protein C4326_09125 [Ignavibacteria bacterium]
MLYALALFVSALSGCKQDPIDPSIERIRLGEFRVGLITSFTNLNEITMSGRIRAYDTRDSLYEAPGIGSFKHFLSFRDTTTNDTLRLFYTLPSNVNFRIDSTQRFVLFYRKVGERFALLLKTKNDSLVCAFGTLLADEWVFVFNRSGNQGLRVSAGDNVYLARNTVCGREGDFDMIFSAHSGEVRVGPARSALLFSGDKVYAVFNVVNTKLIKDLGRCTDFVPEFAFMILRQ